MSDFPFTEPQRKWIAALRSGKFRQGRNFLHKGRNYCCLGVACHIFKRDLSLTLGERWVTLPDEELLVHAYNQQHQNLPTEVYRHLQLRSREGDSKYGVCDNLIVINDNGKTFTEIADILEREPEKYFTNLDAEEQGHE